MLEIHMVPVTNGESIFLRLSESSQEVNILVDGGVIAQECVGYLQNLSVKRLDVVIASHFHWDHVAGLKAVRDAIDVVEYWTGDIRPFEAYCRDTSPSPYVLACLVTADQPLRIPNGRNRLAWDGIRKSFAGGSLILEVLAPPYSLWTRLRQPGVASGLLRRDQAEAYRKKLLGYPDSIQIEEPGEERAEPTERWESVEAIGQEHFDKTDRIKEDEIAKESEPDMARFLSSAHSPWNDMSIVVKATFQSNVGPLSILLPGDLTNWSYVYAFHPSDAKCDLLKVPHHCSDSYLNVKEVHQYLKAEWEFLLSGLNCRGQDWLDKQLRAKCGRRRTPLGCPVFPLAPFPPNVIDWLSPSEALYFPFHHGNNHLPAWTKRQRIRQKVRGLYCTRAPGAPSHNSPARESCRAQSNCNMRSSPVVFRWR